nr:unnamed protein product [Digitaria exilis]
MGSLVSCLSDPCPSASPPPQAKRRSSTSSRGRGGGGGGGGRDSAKATTMAIDEEALAAAAALVLGQRGAVGAFERSASVRYAAKRQSQQGPPLPRSCSTRPRSLADPELQPQQLLAKDVSLASVSMRPIPFAPILEKLVLTAKNYGSVRRFYVETSEDNAIPLPLQQSMCSANPPEKVLRLKGADHAPFFSKPQALHKTLVEIAAMPPVQAS